MAESHVVTGLVAKRAELAGQIDFHRKALGKIEDDLRHIGATIKLFAPEFDLRTVKATAHRTRNQHFKSGEVPRSTLDVLREHGGAMTSRQIAETLLLRKGMNTLRNFKKAYLRYSGFKRPGKSLCWPTQSEQRAPGSCGLDVMFQ